MSSELKMVNEWVRPLLFIAGIRVIASNQIRPGDYVNIESSEEGSLLDITWRHTTIRSLPQHGSSSLTPSCHRRGRHPRTPGFRLVEKDVHIRGRSKRFMKYPG